MLQLSLCVLCVILAYCPGKNKTNTKAYQHKASTFQKNSVSISMSNRDKSKKQVLNSWLIKLMLLIFRHKIIIKQFILKRQQRRNHLTCDVFLFSGTSTNYCLESTVSNALLFSVHSASGLVACSQSIALVHACMHARTHILSLSLALCVTFQVPLHH